MDENKFKFENLNVTIKSHEKFRFEPHKNVDPIKMTLFVFDVFSEKRLINKDTVISNKINNGIDD